MSADTKSGATLHAADVMKLALGGSLAGGQASGANASELLEQMAADIAAINDFVASSGRAPDPNALDLLVKADTDRALATKAMLDADISRIVADMAAGALPVMPIVRDPLLDGSFQRSMVETSRIIGDLALDGAVSQPAKTKPAPEPIKSPQALGQRVRQAREALGMTQAAFADAAGVGRRFVSELENGKATLELGKVMAVCAAAGLDLLVKPR